MPALASGCVGLGGGGRQSGARGLGPCPPLEAGSAGATAKAAVAARGLRHAQQDTVPWGDGAGHTPITGPVRYRNSSTLSYQCCTESPPWRAMVRGGVNVFLCGEVHDQTVTARDGIVQVAHGSLF